MYEHAYQLDFGENATAYIDTFLRNINWETMLKRIAAERLRASSRAAFTTRALSPLAQCPASKSGVARIAVRGLAPACCPACAPRAARPPRACDSMPRVPRSLDHPVARASSEGGIVRPRAFAVFMLMINSNLVGCSMGRSPDFAPFRIFPTCDWAAGNIQGRPDRSEDPHWVDFD